MPHFGEAAGHNLSWILNSNNREFPPTQQGLQDAIDDLPAAGGWVSGPGMHTIITISTPITLPDNVKLKNVRLFLANNSDCNMIENSDQVAGNTNITIENCYLDGNKANQASGHGIDFAGVTNGTIAHSRITQVHNRGIYLEAAPINYYIAISDCMVDNCLYGIWMTVAWCSSVDSCRIHHCDRGIVLSSGYYNSIVGNQIEECRGVQGYCIHLYDGVEHSIIGNTLEYSEYAIAGSGAIGVSIIGNHISGIDLHTIYLTATNYGLTIIGNQIQAVAKLALNTYDVIHIVGDYNTIANNVEYITLPDRVPRYVIYVEGDHNTITGNIMNMIGTDGIHLVGASHNVIMGNRIVDAAAYGICLDADSDYNSIEGNYTSGSVTACARVNNANCDNNMFTNNQFEEGDISNVGTNTRAWLNYDPSANAFITTKNPPQIVDGVGVPVANRFLP